MFIVDTFYNGTQFWLRNTTWSFSEARATRFKTREEAQFMLDKSKKFNAAAAYKGAVIKEVE